MHEGSDTNTARIHYPNEKGMSPDLTIIFTFTITLAFTLGMSIGYRRTLRMVLRELIGVATIFTAIFWSFGWRLSRDLAFFQGISFIGGAYLMFLAISLLNETPEDPKARGIDETHTGVLSLLGYVTTVSNPKGWAFVMALLQGFVQSDAALYPQFITMLIIMLSTEFIAVTAYATGGQWLAVRLADSPGLMSANRVAAIMLGLAGLWVFSGAVIYLRYGCSRINSVMN